MCDKKLLSDLKVNVIKDDLLKFNIETKGLKKLELVDLLFKFKNSQIIIKKDDLNLHSIANVSNPFCSDCDIYKHELNSYRIKLENLSSTHHKLEEEITELNLCNEILNKKLEDLNRFRENLETKTKKLSCDAKSTHSVMILADSHGRNVNKIIKNKLDSKYNSIGIFKPNATFEQVTDNIGGLTSSLSKNDNVIIIAGTNNINNKKYPSFKHIVDIMRLCTKTRLAISTVPYRYDFPYLNKYIFKFNKKLVETVRNFNLWTNEDVDIIDINHGCSRRHYTVHGLHFNAKGKTKIADTLVNYIKFGNNVSTSNLIHIPSVSALPNIVKIQTPNALQTEDLSPFGEDPDEGPSSNSADVSTDDGAMFSAVDSDSDSDTDDDDSGNKTQISNTTDCVHSKSGNFLEN